MDIFFIGFRDPLFSLIIFFILIFIITLVSYWWGRYKNQEDTKKLDEFLDSFRQMPTQDELTDLISSSKISQKSWLLLAKSYYDYGDYEKSIEIYNELLKVSSLSNSKDIMFLLGRTYFKAGFLQRSKDIFLTILKDQPKMPQVLEYLLLVYESLKDYRSALDVLEPLDELNQFIQKDMIYLQILLLLDNKKLSEDKKIEQLLQIYKKNTQFQYLIFQYIFQKNPQVAWKNLSFNNLENLIDIFWFLDKKDLDFDIIAQHPYLQELYSARGDITVVDRSELFEFDLLIKLQNKASVTLSFEYICDNCKQSYPFVFYRCSYCHTLDKMRIEPSLIRDYQRDFNYESNSFQ
ncbi:Putative periplasmic protein [hydrothermal vent metagenome]|uniref:Putative periplasmic protein n=1 Tax=hydrothermal vent metagenome TaxID=652676 RepID=A0A1W1D417_9ZZZZ